MAHPAKLATLPAAYLDGAAQNCKWNENVPSVACVVIMCCVDDVNFAIAHDVV